MEQSVNKFDKKSLSDKKKALLFTIYYIMGTEENVKIN